MTGAVRLGVIMLCHDEPQIATRMARVWAEGAEAVAIHVDVRVEAATLARMGRDLGERPDVLFSPRHACEWGRFSLVRATQEAAELLLRRCPELTHVILVSGACLPLRPVSDLCAYLARHPRRDFIESVTAADVGWTVGGLNEERFTLRFPFSFRRQRKLFDRYVDLQRRLRLQRRIPQGLVPHLGSQWWCLTRATLAAILTDPRRPEFDRYFSHVWIPDESYFQTLARRHSQGIESRSLTLARFDDQGKPHVFYDDHLEMLRQSRCFVARKIWRGASGLYRHFPLTRPDDPPDAEPRPERLLHHADRAVHRRRFGRPGFFTQSCFPAKDRENGKTAAPYAVLQGFAELFPDFEPWLAGRVDADVHGHLFDLQRVEFAGRGRVGPGGLSDSAALRDLDPRGFLASLVRITPRLQVWQHSPRDRQDLEWFAATDANARIFVVTGAWAVPLLHSGMPFDDIRRMAAHLQWVELRQIEVLKSVWLRARAQIWDLADFCARPAGVLGAVLRGLGGDAQAASDLPAMRPVGDMGRFLQELRNAGLRPQLMGDFPATEPAATAAQGRMP
ncbi:beta-1,6-N-acetylglucosaminyltransferase [Paracoccus sp. (in: a-proteobacteria)]|uniref:DUF5927 domain-containing protein n=1 Tax=Paracoccus sp. TaxID=267 RepID=UPI00321F74E6